MMQVKDETCPPEADLPVAESPNMPLTSRSRLLSLRFQVSFFILGFGAMLALIGERQ
jgi:hypothetical protein